MKGSLRIGSLSGIPIRVHFTFLLIPALFAVEGWTQAGPQGAVREVVFILALFACVVLHELGHSLVARSFGIRVKDITLLPIGGVAQLERMPDTPGREIVLALAGPLVNVVIAAALFVGLTLRSAIGPWQDMSVFGDDLLARLMVVNVVLVAFNLLPSFPMDGGRVLRGVLAQFMSRVLATRIAAIVGRIMAVLFLLVGLAFPQRFIWLIFIAVFVYMGAAAEEQHARVQAQLEGLTARDAMIAPFDFLHAADSLASVFDRVQRSFQHDFPVFGDQGAVGFVSRDELNAAGSAGAWETPTGLLVSRPWVSIPSIAPLEEAVMRLQAGRLPIMGVEEAAHVIGLINGQSIVRAVELRQAQREHTT